MKKNLTKKLMLSVLTLAFAVVSLGASTFAWFTMTGTATVESFEAEIISGKGLDIAVTPYGGAVTKWYSGTIPHEDIEAIYNAAEFKFDALTPAAALSAAQEPSFNTYKQAVEGGTDDATGKYIIFDLHFKLTDPKANANDYTLQLTKLDVTNTTVDGIKDWTVDTAYDYAAGKTVEIKTTTTSEGEEVKVPTKVKYDLVSSMRVALLAKGDSNVTIPTDEAVNVYQQAGVETITAAGQNTTGFNQYGALDYYNKKMDKEIELPTNSNVAFEKDNYFGFASTSPVEVAKIKGTGEVVLTVAIWVEGWDGECLNAIFAQKAKFDLAFYLQEPAA